LTPQTQTIVVFVKSDGGRFFAT